MENSKPQGMFGRFQEWMTPERSIAFQGIGMGLSQLAAGQPVNMSSAFEAMQARQQAAQARESLRSSGVLEKFTPQQRAILAQMPAEAAQRIIAGVMFQEPAGPTKGVEINGQLVNPVTGELIGDYRSADAGPERRIIKGADGYNYYADTMERVLPDVAAPQNPRVLLLGPDDPNRAAFGVPDDGKTYKVEVDPETGLPTDYSGTSGQNIAIDLAGDGDDDFNKASAKFQATMFGDMARIGAEAQGELGQINTLEALLADGDIGGTGDALRSYVQQNFGIQVAGGKVEALNAVINRLVPQQRPPGSGVMSDADLQLFKESLPRLVNSPEGNGLILNTMRGMAQFKRQQGEIAAQVMTGQMTRQEGMAALYALPDPMAEAVAAIRGFDAELEEIEKNKDALMDALREQMQ